MVSKPTIQIGDIKKCSIVNILQQQKLHQNLQGHNIPFHNQTFCNAFAICIKIHKQWVNQHFAYPHSSMMPSKRLRGKTSSFNVDKSWDFTIFHVENWTIDNYEGD